MFLGCRSYTDPFLIPQSRGGRARRLVFVPPNLEGFTTAHKIVVDGFLVQRCFTSTLNYMFPRRAWYPLTGWGSLQTWTVSRWFARWLKSSSPLAPAAVRIRTSVFAKCLKIARLSAPTAVHARTSEPRRFEPFRRLAYGQPRDFQD